MQITIAAGKGGVGKSTVAAGLALNFANVGEKTAIVSYDGRSIKRLMGIEDEAPANTLVQIGPSLFVTVVGKTKYMGIQDSQKTGKPIGQYLAQFPADLGILPFADMVRFFFGVPADPVLLEKFIRLVMMLINLEKQGYINVVIDVEPNTGLADMLSNATATMRSLSNLKNYGRLKLAAIGAAWPDIAAYIDGSYIQSIHEYCDNIERAVHLMRHATYLLVCTPLKEAVVQTGEVRETIEEFGGGVHGYVVNEVRGASYEAANIALLSKRAAIVKIAYRPELHEEGSDHLLTLRLIGRAVSPLVWNGR